MSGLYWIFLVRIVHPNLRYCGCQFRSRGKSEGIIVGCRGLLPCSSLLVSSGSVSRYVSLLPHYEREMANGQRSFRFRTNVYEHIQCWNHSSAEKLDIVLDSGSSH